MQHDATSVQQSRPHSATRERMVAAAAASFGDRGYTSTSIAHIQATVGLAPGSGAFYKHFRSKEAVLEAVVDDYIARLDEASGAVVTALPTDLPQALEQIARAVSSAMRGDAAVLRLALRDLEVRPDLSIRVWQAVLAKVPGRFAAWVTQSAREGLVRGNVTHDDAVVLMAALMESSTVAILTGHDFGPMLSDDFESGWVRVALRVLSP